MSTGLQSSDIIPSTSGTNPTAPGLLEGTFVVKDLIADLYQYYPDYPHDYLYRYVDYQVTTKYIDPNTYQIIIRRLDGVMGSADNLKVLVCDKLRSWKQIIHIPNWSESYDTTITLSPGLLPSDMSGIKIEPDTEHSVKLLEAMPYGWVSYTPHYTKISREMFNNIFHTSLVVLPSSIFAFGWDAVTKNVYMYHETEGDIEFKNIHHSCDNIFRVLHEYDCSVAFLMASTDGYMENTYYSETRNIPRILGETECQGLYLPPCCNSDEYLVYEPNLMLLVQSVHYGIPNTIAIPDRHYFYHNLYHSFRSFHQGVSWDNKISMIVFAAQDRDTKYNFRDPNLRKLNINPRRYFREMIAPKYRDIVECTDRWINRTDMISFKYILDIDGAASTWDATAWKLNSGSVIFKPKSSWSQWFYDKYKAGVHYIELEEDFSDLREKYIWCEANPSKCKTIIQNAMSLFQEVYCFQNIVQYTRTVCDRLSTGSFLDHIIYINLDRRTDRRIQFETQAREYRITCERFSAISNDFGILGCSKSHKAVFELALSRKYHSVLIFEDDFEFLVSSKEFRELIHKLDQCKLEFDVCMLAYHLIDIDNIVGYQDWMRIRRATTASAYIVKRHYLPRLIELYNKTNELLENTREHWNYANDQVWSVLQQKDMWICPTIRIGKQRDGYSDNSNQFQENSF